MFTLIFSYVDIQFSFPQKVINNLQVSQNSLNCLEFHDNQYFRCFLNNLITNKITLTSEKRLRFLGKWNEIPQIIRLDLIYFCFIIKRNLKIIQLAQTCNDKTQQYHLLKQKLIFLHLSNDLVVDKEIKYIYLTVLVYTL